MLFDRVVIVMRTHIVTVLVANHLKPRSHTKPESRHLLSGGVQTARSEHLNESDLLSGGVSLRLRVVQNHRRISRSFRQHFRIGLGHAGDRFGVDRPAYAAQMLRDMRLQQANAINGHIRIQCQRKPSQSLRRVRNRNIARPTPKTASFERSTEFGWESLHHRSSFLNLLARWHFRAICSHLQVHGRTGRRAIWKKQRVPRPFGLSFGADQAGNPPPGSARCSLI